MTDEKILFIPKIENGHVIDHIPAGLGSGILAIVGFHPELSGIPVTLGMNFKSRRLGTKDLMKLQIDELPPAFVRHLSLIAPGVTIKRIKKFKVERKIVAEPPEIINGLLKCPNPNCISNSERHLRTCFHCLEKKPMVFACNFCERHFAIEELEPILQVAAKPSLVVKA